MKPVRSARKPKGEVARQSESSSPHLPISPRSCILLGSGTVNRAGTSVLVLNTAKQQRKDVSEPNTDNSCSGDMKAKTAPIENGAPAIGNQDIGFKRSYSSFLRVADLQMDETVSLKSVSTDSDESYPNYHRSAVDPPPGVETDPNERWVVLDDGDGNHAPIAPVAVSALARSGLASCYDLEMWVPDGKTAKTLKQYPAWNMIAWQKEGPVKFPGDGSLNESEILVWSGTFKHGCYGSELPAVRSCGIINMDPQALMELLVDSNRVCEYNKLCLGRSDIQVLQPGMDEDGPFGGITKVMKTESKPPMIRKTLRFTTLMHARELEDGSGYKMVTRAVTLPKEKEDLANALKSEILLGATIIKRVEGKNNCCFFVSVNHLRSPMVPMMIAKRIGLSAAVGFFQDLRGCCK